MRLRAGTSGYSYKHWKGNFYPEKLKAGDMLGYYAGRLDTVEINSTFYRMPSEKTLLNWDTQVPGDFSFVLKASRRITHQKQLDDAGDSLSYLLEKASVLGRKLGPFLFQLPPFMRKDLKRLRRFLDLLPKRVRAAFEFRHRSWFDDEVYDALRERNVALVVADAEKGEDPTIVATADYGYLRLRREQYDVAALAAWHERIRAQPWDSAWAFFKHEEGGAAARQAEQLARLG